MSDTKLNVFTILSVISSIISLVLYPTLFAIIGAILGFVIRAKKNEKRGNILLILAIICGITGSIIGVAFS